MVVPPRGLITVGIADLRADPDDHSELVDQAHLNEQVTVLGARSDWRYVQGADQYFGWVRTDQLFEIPGSNSDGIVAVLLADVHERESRNSPVIERLPRATVIAGEIDVMPLMPVMVRVSRNTWLLARLSR